MGLRFSKNGIATFRAVNTPDYDADAQAFITASGISGTEATATNQLVLDLKSASIWTKMKALYPMVGGTAFTCKWNLKNPVDSNAAFRLLFSGGGTFSSNGYQPNGTNAYADTFLVPNTVTTLNSLNLSYYSRTNTTPVYNSVNIGCWDGGGFQYTFLSIKSLSSATVTYSLLQQTTSATYPTFVDTDSLGFYTTTRTSTNLTTIYKNGVSKTTNGTTSTGQPSTRTIYIGAANGNTLNYSNRECAFASIGDGLSDAEASAFYTAVQTFQTTLGRQV